MEFLIDEMVTGIYRYLDNFEIKYRKIGDDGCPDKGSSDSEVAKFAEKNNLVVITTDDDLKKQCEFSGVACVFSDLRDFAEKVNRYVDSHKEKLD